MCPLVETAELPSLARSAASRQINSVLLAANCQRFAAIAKGETRVCGRQ